MTESLQQFVDEFVSRGVRNEASPEVEEEPPFELSLCVQGAVLYVLLRGELEFHNIGRFNAAVDEALLEPECKTVVVHMGAVSFVDSTGLACLVNAYQTAKERGGRVHLVECTSFVLKTLEITHLKRVFVLHETFSDAFTAANPPDEAP